MAIQERDDIEAATKAERTGKRYRKGAIVFGIIMATIEMGVLLYFMYC